jgi:hypothetical protein
MKFQTIRKANAEARRLEKLLGLPEGVNHYRIAEANQRVKELQDMLASKTSSGAVASNPEKIALPPVAVSRFAAAPVSSPPAPPKAAHPDRETLLEIVESVFPLEALGHCERMTDTALLQHVQKLVWQAGLKMPAPCGTTDAEMESRGVWRTDPKAGGIARTMRADRQAKLDYITKL